MGSLILMYQRRPDPSGPRGGGGRAAIRKPLKGPPSGLLEKGSSAEPLAMALELPELDLATEDWLLVSVCGLYWRSLVFLVVSIRVDE